MARFRRPDSPDSIDLLYQAPLAEFTAMRNSLAKHAGADRAAVRQLRKPNLPAWAVNQLYWQRRAVWDALVEAAERVRVAHGRRLSGKSADVETAEAAHRDAVRTAVDEIRGLLRDAGETASGSTISAVIETLQALPGSEPPGRMTRPLKPQGLEALSGLLPAGRVSLRAVGDVPRSATAARQFPRRSKAADAREARARTRAAEERKRKAARLDGEIREAASAARKAAADVSRARQALSRAEREREHLAERLKFLEKRTATAAGDLRLHETRAREAAETHASLVRTRKALDLDD